MNMKIVIVEDEAAIRKGLAGLLPKISPDYEVAGTAADGREGLELIRREHPALVILDIRMPGMDGMTMLRVLRSEGNPCRAVVLSAYSDFEYAKTAIDLGVESYLLKPVKVRELEDVLRLTQARIRQEEEEEQGRETSVEDSRDRKTLIQILLYYEIFRRRRRNGRSWQGWTPG